MKDPAASSSPSRSKPRQPKSPSAGTKHRAVANILRDEILSGAYSLGEQIPSEQVLAKRFGVAYMTARQAVSSLVAEGVLERIARKGTFVVQGSARTEPVSRNTFVLLIEGGKTSLDPYYLPPIIEAFEREIRFHGYELAVYDYSIAILNSRTFRGQWYASNACIAPACCSVL